MASLDQLLSRVVERRGYAVVGADREAIFARKSDGAILVAWKLDASFTTDDARLFLTAMEQVQASSGILVALKGTDAGAKETLSANGVETWPESRLVLEVGQALVQDAIEAPAAPAQAVAPASAPAAAPAARAVRTFPSLLAQAASVASGDTRGAAVYITNKPAAKPAAPPAAGTPRALGYAWGGGMGTTVDPGVAQVRNGRKPRSVEAEPAPINPLAAAAAPAQYEDVEIISTPRRKPEPAPAAPPVKPRDESGAEILSSSRRRAEAEAATAPAPAKAASAIIEPDDSEEYEIITTKKPAKQKELPSPSAVEVAGGSTGANTVLRVAIEPAEALKRAGKSGQTRMTLVPHVAFEYDLKMHREGMSVPLEAKGAVLASSVTGELKMLDKLEFHEAEPADARKEPEKLHAVDVYDKVKGHVARTYTKVVKAEREVAGNAVMENIKLTPDTNEMGLNHRGVVLVPVWEVVGTTGIVRVDAHTGDVIG